MVREEVSVRVSRLDRAVLVDAVLYTAGTFTAAGCGLAAYQAEGWKSAFLAGVLGLAAGGFFRARFTRRLLTAVEALQDILIPAILAISAQGTLRLWQVPTAWSDLVTLTGQGSALFCLVYLSSVLCGLALTGRHVRPLTGCLVLLIPYVFNALLLVGSPGLIERIGDAVAAGSGPAEIFSRGIGRAMVLAVFNEAVTAGISLYFGRRWITDGRVHGLLLGCAVLASLTPEVASWGSGAAVGSMPGVLRIPAALGAAVLSQAGLWSETFLMTGMIMDAFHGRQPTWYWGSEHFRSGLTKGAVYSLVFMSLIQGLSILSGIPSALSFLASLPLAASALVGAAAFPGLKTIVETFDGSEMFFQRAGRSYMDSMNYLRGGVLGAFCGYALAHGLPEVGGTERFLFGLAAGATAYAGVDLLRDALEIATGKRQRFQTWRMYALGAALGGGAGGALAWYLEAAQMGVLTGKFFKYAAIHYPEVGRHVEDYVIYPLCSKWGAMNLGATEGGVRLFYNESLSGVINWSIAAPLFSINLVALTALLRRSTGPLKGIFTGKGVVGLVEQAVRVLRWGLWMAPVIYSFLRMSPDPTWYNQDGAVRTVAATVKAWSLDPEAFRAWSLHTFLSLLVYDWLRVLIYVDHMGLRVATLVNLSFVGVDILDEKAARAVGHSGRARWIPEGIRRFGTWAPLLIPFYLPRGVEWDYVWSRSEVLQRELMQGFWSPITYVAGGFLLVALGVGSFSLIRRLRVSAATGCGEAASGEKTHVLSNGVYTVELTTGGRGFSRVFSGVRKGAELDITRRPDDPLQMRGKFFYLLDREKGKGSAERFWSIAACPVRRETEVGSVTRTGPLSMVMARTCGGIRAEAALSLDPAEPVERWRIGLHNMEDRPRRIELVSYQEWGLNDTDACRRHPFFNHLHVRTRFVRPLCAILAGNRLLKDGERDVTRRRMSGETAFHGLREDPAQGIVLLGYEDSRARFIGKETLAAPAALEGDMRSPEDEGLLYTFDPVASLRVRVELPALGSSEVTYFDGYGVSERQALECLCRHMGVITNEDPLTWNAFRSIRQIADPKTKQGSPGKGEGRGFESVYEFSARGTELTVGWNTPRPWGHVMANPLGYGTLVTNDGGVFSFMGNAQQNGLTPFDMDSVTPQAPGQVFYVMNMDTGETDSPMYVPFRHKDGKCESTWGIGYAVFRKKRGAVDLELTLFVPPDQPAEVRLFKIRNRGHKSLRFRVVPYAQMMLGEAPVDTRGGLDVHSDRDLGAVFFSNPRNDFQRGWAFAATSLPVEALETVRSRFLGGRDRDLTRPFMVERGEPDCVQPDDGFRIAGFVGTLIVPPGGERAMTMVVGQASDIERAAEIIRGFRGLAAAEGSLERTRTWWSEFLGVLRLETNDCAFDRMVNSWLAYQTLVARLWGRLGPYQRSGAYGYRDQLQDVLPFLFLHPDLARRQILLHAAQQFREGDVLQWWHQSWEGKTGIGVRGRAADPHLWLPYVVSRYVKATGDRTVLDEKVPFLEGKALGKRSEGVLFAPRPSRDRATLYRHCLMAVDVTLKRRGSHGLPLLGAGDWNDSLDMAGFKGRGESVWMGFFLHDVLLHFAGLVGEKEGSARMEHYLGKAEELRRALDCMWRGDRYVRVLTDDGREMTRVNALVAGWSILSGASDFERGSLAMETALRELERENLVQLFSPPYSEDSPIYPGRMADYPAGVRENGGQYSHGVSWLVDGLLVLAETARDKGLTDRSLHYRSKAMELWRKISPLVHLDELTPYGLPPHQQPADVSYGPGYEGRGGWSWYTGAAARMLCAAYGLFGLRIEDGKLIQPPDLHESKGSLTLRNLEYKRSHPSGE